MSWLRKFNNLKPLLFFFKTASGKSLLLTNKSIKFQSFLIKNIFKTPGLENCKELETNWLHMTTVFGDIHRWIVFIYCNSKIVSILYYSVPYKVCVWYTMCFMQYIRLKSLLSSLQCIQIIFSCFSPVICFCWDIQDSFQWRATAKKTMKVDAVSSRTRETVFYVFLTDFCQHLNVFVWKRGKKLKRKWMSATPSCFLSGRGR